VAQGIGHGEGRHRALLAINTKIAPQLRGNPEAKA
jgi:hypothetical protein